MNDPKQDKADCAMIIFSAMNSRSLEALEEYLADNVVFDFPGTEPVKGRKKVLLFLKILMRKYPKLIFHVEDCFTQENKVCVRWHNEGENSQGEPYANRGVTLVELINDKIVFISDYFKDTSFTRDQSQ